MVFSQYTQGLLKANLVYGEHLPQYLGILALFIKQHLGNIYMQDDAVSCFDYILSHKIFDQAIP